MQRTPQTATSLNQQQQIGVTPLTTPIIFVDNGDVLLLLLEAMNDRFSPMTFGAIQVTTAKEPATYAIFGCAKSQDNYTDITNTPLMSPETLRDMVVFAEGYRNCHADIHDEDEEDGGR